MFIIVNSVQKVFEFDPIIYPVPIWIAVSTDAEELSKKFNLEILELPDYLVAKTQYVKYKDNCGVLIRFKDKDSITFKTVSHESSHAALKIFDKVGGHLDSGSDELFAYLCGFIGDCVLQVCEDLSKK